MRHHGRTGRIGGSGGKVHFGRKDKVEGGVCAEGVCAARGSR